MGYSDAPPKLRTVSCSICQDSGYVPDSSRPYSITICSRCVGGLVRPSALPSGPQVPKLAAPLEALAVDLSILSLPDDDAKRGEYPMADGLLDYFPNALAEVSKVSKIGNDQHNPGQPLNWARDKSTDHANKIMRHLVDRGRFDGRGVRHTARLAWRALAMLQTEIEQEEGFPQSRRSTGQAPTQAGA